MIRLLGLDPSDFCGWCHGIPGETPIYGVHRMPKAIYSRKALALEAFLIDLIKGSGIQKVYVEKPILPKVTSFQAMIATAGKASIIGMTCGRLGIDCHFVDMQTWRSEFGVPTQAPKRIKDKAERRKWVKAQTVAKCESMGLLPQDDNAADAIGIWSSVAKRILDRAASPSLFETDLMADLEV